MSRRGLGLLLVGCFVAVFVAYEVHSVVQALARNSAAQASERPSSGGASAPAAPDPGFPTVAYPELCHGLVRLDESTDLKLTDEEKKKMLPLLHALAETADKMHDAEARMLETLTPAQKKWVQEHRDDLMRASVQPGPPPLDVALNHLTGAPLKKPGRR